MERLQKFLAPLRGRFPPGLREPDPGRKGSGQRQGGPGNGDPGGSGKGPYLSGKKTHSAAPAKPLLFAE